MDRFKELLQYVKEHSNVLVPHKYEANPIGSLGLPKAYKKVLLSPERIQKLSEIGFIWDAQEAQWSEIFEELKQ
jgi:hypothetical protein